MTFVRVALFVGTIAALLSASSVASAYPWMIRHGYASCTPCHTDPSGGAGALTGYGRAQGDLLLRMRYGDDATTGERSATSDFLFGLLPTPDALRLGGDFRESFLSTQVERAPIDQRFITMRADLYGDLKLGRLRAAGSIGYAPTGDRAASLTAAASDNLVSREHWVGVELDDDGQWLLRAGRIALPYGVRTIEHTLFVRTLTRTDLDATQQAGVALFFQRDLLRGEIMGIAGNFQVHPDELRQRGYSAYLEYEAAERFVLGASSQFTRASRDLVFAVTDYRYSNGVFVRASPTPSLVLLAEGDWVYQSLTWNGHRGGYAGFAQLDYEPVQGFHAMLTGETMNGGASGEPSSYAGWLSTAWFFLPHMDLRADGIFSVLGAAAPAGGAGSIIHVTTWLAQVHVFL